ncbi:MAG TPA: hypothetical protein VJN96_09190 [Vicinamibacterales bacterium]|nr:hypothetical protein [Vicinamibacterales bacterium]
MDGSVLEIIHIGVTIAIAIIGALVVQPIREMRRDLADLVERLARLEGREQMRDARGWNGDERRHGR